MTIGGLKKECAPVFKDILLARQKMDCMGSEGKKRDDLGSYISPYKRIGWLRLELWKG